MKLFTDYVSGSWTSGISNGCTFNAKIYDDKSQYGINKGRVSKLEICEGEVVKLDRNVLYNFDRGLDFDNLPEGILDLILADLESL